MQPQFGWTLLSQDALRRVETQMRDEVEGVRDEIGFLSLHQAYADRFFPGTSVPHTRLRYVLFVPWMNEKISRMPNRYRMLVPEESSLLIQMAMDLLGRSERQLTIDHKRLGGNRGSE